VCRVLLLEASWGNWVAVVGSDCRAMELGWWA